MQMRQQARDQTLTNLAKLNAHSPRENTPDVHHNAYIDFLIEHINTDPRGHRLWLGNLDATVFEYVVTHVPSLRTATLNPSKISKVHATLWGGADLMADIRAAVI